MTDFIISWNGYCYEHKADCIKTFFLKYVLIDDEHYDEINLFLEINNWAKKRIENKLISNENIFAVIEKGVNLLSFYSKLLVFIVVLHYVLV